MGGVIVLSAAALGIQRSLTSVLRVRHRPITAFAASGEKPESESKTVAKGLVFDRFGTEYDNVLTDGDDADDADPEAKSTDWAPEEALLRSLTAGGREKEPGYERVFLVGVEQRTLGDEGAKALRQQQEDLLDAWEQEDVEWGIVESLQELGELARTAGLQVVGTAFQRKALPDPRTYLGAGKLQEVITECLEKDVQFVIFDEELSPSQMRNIDKVAEKVRKEFIERGEDPNREVGDLRVMDRTNLILDIFAQHARTREGILQVALAEQQYQLPRLKRMWSHLERQQGFGGGQGMGRGGMGEKQKEVDRRLIETSILRLRKELARVQVRRAQLRAGRSRIPFPTVTIVGYTNAGKSTLLNHLTNAGVIAEDMLFATLDPTTRKVILPNGLEVLLTDTVGFIQKLPTTLIAAFKSTLEELQEASLIIHLVDIASTGARAQMRAVEQILEEVGAKGVPVLNVWNKVDRLPPARATQLRRRAQFTENTIVASALDGTGIPELLETMEAMLQVDLIRVEALLPWSEGSLLSEVHERGSDVQESYAQTGEGTHVRGLVPQKVANKLQPYAHAFPTG